MAHEGVVYVCCFCGAAIARVTGPQWYLTLRSEPPGGAQDLFAHPACLRAQVHPAVPLLSESVPARGAHA